MSLEIAGFVISILSTGMECIGLIVLFDASFSSKVKSFARYLSITILGILITYCMGSYIHSPLLKSMISIMVYCSFAHFFYKGTWIGKLVYSLLYYSFTIGCDVITLFTISCVVGEGWELVHSNFELILCAALLSKTLLFGLSCAIYKYRSHKRFAFLQWYDWVWVGIVPLITCLTFVVLFTNQTSSQKIPILTVLDVIALISMNVFAFFIINWFSKRDEMTKQKDVLEQEVRKLKQAINYYVSTQDRLNGLSHDINNHFTCICDLLNQCAYDKAKQYLISVTQEMPVSIQPIHSNNVLVDCLLNQKYLFALDQGIQMDIQLNDLSELPLEEFDFITVLSNIMDNAIEACMLVPTNRRICLNIVFTEGYIAIISKNTAANKIEWENGNVRTSKENTSKHGYGLLNIKRIVNKYAGLIEMESTDSSFYIVIYFPITN